MTSELITKAIKYGLGVSDVSGKPNNKTLVRDWLNDDDLNHAVKNIEASLSEHGFEIVKKGINK